MLLLALETTRTICRIWMWPPATKMVSQFHIKQPKRLPNCQPFLEMMMGTLCFRLIVLLLIAKVETSRRLPFQFKITAFSKTSHETWVLSEWSVSGKNIRLDHYLLPNKLSPAYLHRAPILLTGQDMDEENNFIWCQFRRPIKPKSMWELDLSHPLFHFYFAGKKNGSM